MVIREDSSRHEYRRNILYLKKIEGEWKVSEDNICPQINLEVKKVHGEIVNKLMSKSVQIITILIQDTLLIIDISFVFK